MVLKYIDMLDNTIQACVDATNQTFVGALKEAVYNGATSMRYIDTILYEWNKNNIKTI